MDRNDSHGVDEQDIPELVDYFSDLPESEAHSHVYSTNTPQTGNVQAGEAGLATLDNITVLENAGIYPQPKPSQVSLLTSSYYSLLTRKSTGPILVVALCSARSHL
jgi:hypothetical protein